MPQIQLPVCACGVTDITSELGYEKRDGRVRYFNGAMPVFSHAEDDVATFRMITSQFCANGNCTQPDIVRAFGVPLTTVKRYCALYRSKGVAGFYAPRARRGAAVLTEPVVREAQERLDEGQESSQVAEALGIKRDTFQKAIKAGKLHARKKKTSRR